MNEALRNALTESGLTQFDLAARLSVDPKTVEKWLAGRTPHPRTRTAVANLVRRDENELWPSAIRTRPHGTGVNEIHAVYPHRWAVPRAVWRELFLQAEKQIDILVYSGLFIAEDTGLTLDLAEKAQAGVAIRLLLGCPSSTVVAQRGVDEGLGDSTAGRIRNAIALLRPLAALEGVELRLHQTILYNSIYRADNDLLVNPHIYGMPGQKSPTLHLHKKINHGLASTYLESIESVWRSSEPYTTV
ncbi:MAG TPA: XRE family transcriptional regulator [Actinocrinis sp.]|nr:XRE family transcriptional regulator [Actinocrinis sp.]